MPQSECSTEHEREPRLEAEGERQIAWAAAAPSPVCVARNERWRFSHADENGMKMSTPIHTCRTKKPNQSIIGVPCNSALMVPTTATAMAVGL